jgi:hypothetical protein
LASKVGVPSRERAPAICPGIRHNNRMNIQ